MNILLHICCAPCAIGPIDLLRKDGHLLAGFFYNPNIHPYSEYLKRKAEADRYGKEVGLRINESGYNIDDYFEHIVYNEGSRERCPSCWWLRALRAAKFAKENGFDSFTTTLLASPYQDHEVLKSICEDVGKNCGIEFYYKDFRPFFKESQAKAREKGIYMQNYCGCLYSEMEKIDGKGQKKVKSLK
ncbi:MAG: epoxyqueuosine reductase QueH [Candidatus Omnitrophica bacterium]|nr:epoxyqueuosine reductase QueH [Candidatus Omnitrophota bacterium]